MDAQLLLLVEWESVAGQEVGTMIGTHTHRVFASALRGKMAAALLIACSLGAMSASAHSSQPVAIEGLAPEVLDDPPDPQALRHRETTPAATIVFGRFSSIQVNVDATGANIRHDAANEPTIAVDPNDPTRMAIGWRQFDSDKSNFRQAGFGYTANGGLNWTTGTIDPGVFRSDPVLGANAEGTFFYNSLGHSSNSKKKKNGDFLCSVFSSTDRGMTWGPLVSAFGGDKEWMTIDRTSGTGHDNIYESWSLAGNPTAPNTFSRSIDGGQSFQLPTSVPTSPFWGTLDVGPDGTVYIVGLGFDGFNFGFYVARSTDAQNPISTPTFTAASVNLGGILSLGAFNPQGILGQPWIAVDPSIGPRSGWLYVLCSVSTPTDPLDIMFSRSTDGGQTWSAPVRVNDDAVGNRAYQWFGTMSVAPHGRIDVVWNDTRGSADSTKSALYYSYSNDGGMTWSANEQASPTWDCTIGWPKQKKIGDYYHMTSRDDGADLAWAATFNGEEDVYYLRIPPPVVPVASGRTAPLRLSSSSPDATDPLRLGGALSTPTHSLALRGSQPNPFVSSTTIRFEIPGVRERVKLEVFDAGGRRVATLVDGLVSAGVQSIRWKGTDDAGRAVKPGLYLCRLEARNPVISCVDLVTTIGRMTRLARHARRYGDCAAKSRVSPPGSPCTLRASLCASDARRADRPRAERHRLEAAPER